MTQPSVLDIRTPIGLMFVVVGAILAVYGMLAGPAAYARAGLNINLWWGLVLLVFGGVMLALARRKAP